MILLDPSYLRMYGREETEILLRRLVCSVKFELLEAANAVRLLGPDMSYHSVDPYLPEVLQRYMHTVSLRDVMAYRSHERYYDFCFEDSWSGYFIADRLRQQSAEEDLVLVHLDDHTDMMPTLLRRNDGILSDPMLGSRFDPAADADWEASIHSGCVSIGNFITPLFYSKHKVHVRHLNNRGPRECEPVEVFQASFRYDLIPKVEFAGLRMNESEQRSRAGTYAVGSCARRILANLPEGKIVIHIDLDYFINDFNGNPRSGDYIPEGSIVEAGRRKLNLFFDALQAVKPKVDRWIVATSPGFCSACHWDWLLREIEENIRKFQSAL